MAEPTNNPRQSPEPQARGILPPAPQVSPMLKEFAVQREDLLNALPYYRAAGLSLKLQDQIVFLSQPGLRPQGEYYDLIPNLSWFEKITKGSALESVEDTRAVDRDVPPALRRSAAPVEVPGYIALSEQGADKKKNQLTIFDLILGKPVMTLNFQRDGSGMARYDKTEKAKLLQTLSGYQQQHQRERESFLAGIKPAADAARAQVYSIYRDRPLPAEEQRLLVDLVKSGNLSLGSAALGRKMDDPPRVALTPANLPGHSLAVAGPITEIVISYNLPGKNPEGGEANLEIRYKDDRFNNIIQNKQWQIPGEATRVVSTISPPLKLLQPGDTNNFLYPVPFSLEPIGLKGEITQLLYQSAVRPYSAVKGIHFYTTLPPARVRATYEGFFPEVVRGAARAEMLFGFASGSHCQSVFISPTSKETAYFSGQNPQTIVVSAKRLTETATAHVAGFHETIHLLDNALKHKLADSLYPLWRRFGGADADERSSFLYAINEKRFLPNAGRTGHAHTSSDEFAASLLTSTFSCSEKEWQAAVGRMEFAHLRNYADSLNAVQAGLASAAGAAKPTQTAFITQHLPRRIAQLEAIITEAEFSEK